MSESPKESTSSQEGSSSPVSPEVQEPSAKGSLPITAMTEEQIQKDFKDLKNLQRSKGELSKKERKKLLKKLKKAVISQREEIVRVISEDFGGRASYETLAAEVMLMARNIRHTLQHLDDWMEIQDKELSPLFWPASIQVRPQSLGVVGIISPWNYSVSLAITPIAQAISAGNRVMLKPSENTPKVASFLKRFLQDALGDDIVRVCVGDTETAIAFSKQPFDHLFFTGSPDIGKKVMSAAAENLTPVTLELGGKTPALIHPSYSISKAAGKIAAGKFFNAGQTCISPDYVLCPKDKVSALVEGIQASLSKMYKTLEGNDDYTSIINERQRERVRSLLQDAKDKGAKVTEFNPANETLSIKIAPQIIENPSQDMRILQEEIFGPLLPIVPYSTLEEAIDYINDRPRPLALYYFDTKKKRINQVLNQTHSGGVCINDTLLHVSQEELPFGGIGNSGMGMYHGKYGFDTFTHYKGVYKQSQFNWIVPRLSRPPYPGWVRAIVRFLTGW
ncbi:MAG: coniferyl aldehyde dehydrogenase [Myxococcota bacterium]|nr:coniferyl aldehyde dehydrogenase [Myxococcota bacterium]